VAEGREAENGGHSKDGSRPAFALRATVGQAEGQWPRAEEKGRSPKEAGASAFVAAKMPQWRPALPHDAVSG
jgi:hypothetical protein